MSASCLRGRTQLTVLKLRPDQRTEQPASKWLLADAPAQPFLYAYEIICLTLD